MRERILETITATLRPLEFVLALWQGGSAAHNYTDEWSDIDIEVIVQDDHVQETFDALESCLKTISEITFKFRVPEPTWHGHSQCFYQLAGVSPFLVIDFAVMKLSSSNHFMEVERHGYRVLGFDKANLLVPTPLDRSEHCLKMQARFAQLSLTFKFLQIQVKKEINRGHRVEAIANYYTYSLQPLLELLGMVYRPYRYDFRNAKYFSRDFPPEVVARVEPLFYVIDLTDLARKQYLVELLFTETLPYAADALRAWE